jgi:hypothetical protein
VYPVIVSIDVEMIDPMPVVILSSVSMIVAMISRLLKFIAWSGLS